MKERRRFVRFDIDTELVISRSKSADNDKVRTKNIGALGICFVSGKQWTVGEIVHMQCVLPNSGSVNLKGEVIWSKIIDPKEGYRTGLKIIGVEDGEETNFMMFYCDRLMEEYYNWRNQHQKE